MKVLTFHRCSIVFVVTTLLLFIKHSLDFSLLVAASPVRACSLADYKRNRGTCVSPTSTRKITYELRDPTSCDGPASIFLGEEQWCSVCELNELVPVDANNQILEGANAACGFDGTHQVHQYKKVNSSSGQLDDNCQVVDLKGSIPCVCTADDIRSTFTECVDGTRKMVYYFGNECDDVAHGTVRHPKARFGPCDVNCDHGEYAGPLCNSCPRGTYSFSGHQFVAPYEQLPAEFVDQCYEIEDGVVTVCGATEKETNPNYRAPGWAPSLDKEYLTTGDASSLRSGDVQIIWHFDVVTLPASISFEYRMETDEFFNEFAVQTDANVLMWQAGSFPAWQFYQYNFSASDIPAAEICSWALDGKVCVHANQLAPYDPASFWSPSTSSSSSSSSTSPSSTVRSLNILPIPIGKECDPSAYIDHPGLAATSSSANNNNIFVAKESSPSASSCSFSQMALNVVAAKGNGVIFVVESADGSLRGNASDFPRGIYIGSISNLLEDRAHVGASPTQNFVNNLFSSSSVSSSQTLPLRWNKNPGHRVEVVFIYSKYEEGFVPNEYVHLRNIKVVGTVAAQEKCELCPPGFSSLERSESCFSCPANFYAPGYGTTCLPCGEGEISPQGSSKCFAVRNCTIADFEPYEFGCHLNTTLNKFQQLVTYKVAHQGLCHPTPEITSQLADKIVDCLDFCPYGAYFEPKDGQCKYCPDEQNQIVFTAPDTRQQYGCVSCNSPGSVADYRFQVNDFFIFNGTLPTSQFSTSTIRCLDDVGWTLSVLGDLPSSSYDNGRFFSSPFVAHRGTTVLSVGDSVLAGGSATLTLDYYQEISGLVQFLYFFRIPYPLYDIFASPQFSHIVEVEIFDTTIPSKPVRIDKFLVAPVLDQSGQVASSGYLTPGPKRVTWKYQNPLKDDTADQIIFGIHSLIAKGARGGHAELCQPTPFGYSYDEPSKKLSPCPPGNAAVTGSGACTPCVASNPAGLAAVAPSSISETCRLCSTFFEQNVRSSTFPFPSSSFCSLEKKDHIYYPGFSQTEATAIVHTSAQSIVADPAQVPSNNEIVALPDSTFTASYMANSFVFDLKFLTNYVSFPSSASDANLDISFSGANPNLVSCLSDYDKETSNISFGCASTLSSQEEFSIGNHLNLIPLPPVESDYKVGLLATVSGLPCRQSWKSGDRTIRKTTIQMVCDPSAAFAVADTTSLAGSSSASNNNNNNNNNVCDIHVFVRWRLACPICTTKNIGFSTSGCDGTSNVRTTSYYFIDAFRRKAVVPVCYGGVSLPKTTTSNCPWIHEPIQPSNLEVVAIFLCVITLVSLIVFTVVYLVRNNTKIKQKYTFLRDTLGQQVENRERRDNNNNLGNNSNVDPTGVMDEESGGNLNNNNNSNNGMIEMSPRNNGRGSSAIAAATANIISKSRKGGSSRNNSAQAVSNIAEISHANLSNNNGKNNNKTLVQSQARVVAPTNNNNNDNNQNDDDDDDDMAKLDEMNDVHGAVYSPKHEKSKDEKYYAHPYDFDNKNEGGSPA